VARSSLASVDWARLYGAYGSARGVGSALARLLEDGTPEAELADLVESLRGDLIVEDHHLTDASALALPFMLEAAERRACPVRSELLALVLDVLRFANEPFVEPTELEDASPEYQQQMRMQRSWVADVRARVAGERERLIDWLSDGDAEVRALSALLVAESAPVADRDATRRTLEHMLAGESDPRARFACLAALEQLGAYESAAAYLDDPDFALSLLAALMLLRLHAPPEQAFLVVSRALEEPERTREGYGDAERLRPLRLVGDVTRAGREVATRLLPALEIVLHESGPYAADLYLAPLLDVFFPGPPEGELTAPQRDVLEAIAGHPRYFDCVGNPALVLRSHGLPTDRAGLLRLAEQGPSGAG
jgi:hypothetical protein